MDVLLGQSQEVEQFECLIQGLIDHQYGYCDDFMDFETILGLRNNIKNYSGAGEFQESGIGNKTKYQKNVSIRSDKIKWIEDHSLNKYELVFRQKLNNFIQHLNATCYTSINRFEAHYASYPPNSFYKRHLDQFKSEKGRKFSLILYLNEEWSIADGGVLALYPKNSSQIDILPIGGRLVFFRSDEMEHEVFPSLTRDRMSIAAWLKN